MPDALLKINVYVAREKISVHHFIMFKLVHMSSCFYLVGIKFS